jgi:hypothetical protein
MEIIWKGDVITIKLESTDFADRHKMMLVHQTLNASRNAFLSSPLISKSPEKEVTLDYARCSSSQ